MSSRPTLPRDHDMTRAIGSAVANRRASAEASGARAASRLRWMTLGSIHKAVLEIPERSSPLVDDRLGKALPRDPVVGPSAALRLADAGLVMRVTGARHS
jgi:hypothetical protein